MVDLAPLVHSNPKPATDKRRQIFTELPHITMDNHFSGDHIIKLLGERGGRGCWTTQRGRLIKKIPKTHLHGKKGVDINARSKAARYMQPIVAVKHVTPPPPAAGRNRTQWHM